MTRQLDGLPWKRGGPFAFLALVIKLVRMAKPASPEFLTSLQTIVAHLLSVDPSTVSVMGEVRPRDVDNKDALAVDIRINGELLSPEHQAQVEDLLSHVSRAAQEIEQARSDIFGAG